MPFCCVVCPAVSQHSAGRMRVLVVGFKPWLKLMTGVDVGPTKGFTKI